MSPAEIAKDILSLLIYLLYIPFQKNKNAVLVYHAVSTLDHRRDPLKMSVDPTLFDAHMKYIARYRERYTVTFDDGFESVYKSAFPILKKYRVKAALFLTLDFVDSKLKLGHFFDNIYCENALTWPQIREMTAYGIDVGSHSLTHRNMASLGKEEAYSEAFLSRERIKEMTGYCAESFSYPFGGEGSFSKRTEEVLRASGYRRAYTNIMGMDNSLSQPFKASRIRIYSTDNIFRFRMKVSGAYNWVDLLTGFVARRSGKTPQ